MISEGVDLKFGKFKVALLLISMIVLLLYQSYCIEISEYSVKAYVGENEVNENIEIKIHNNENREIETFRYPFVGKIYYFNVLGNKSCTSSYEGGKTYITCKFKKPIKPGENATIKYVFKKPIEKTDNLYILKISYILFANVKSFNLEVKFAEGYIIAENGVSPAGYKLDSDGRHVIVRWEYEKIPAELRSFRAIILYEKVAGKYTLYYYGIAILIVILAFLIIKPKIFKKRKKEEIISKIEVLKEDEQKILKIIIENEGIEQRKIEEITGFSKAKVSKILSELEKRGLIVKKAFGRKNRIYLSDKMKS